MARVAVLTGASRGVGAATAVVLAERGTGWSSTIVPVHPRPGGGRDYRRGRWRSRGE